FDRKYLEEAVPVMKDQSGTFGILADSPGDVPKVAAAIDDMFHNSPQQTKTESEKAFGLTSWRCSATSKRSFLASAERWCSRVCWFRRIPWRCRFASARAKWPC